MKKVAIVTSASGSGGTTVGREIAARLQLPFHELDALFWQPNWTEPDPEEFRERVATIVATDDWVIDGSYRAGSANSSSGTRMRSSGYPSAHAGRGRSLPEESVRPAGDSSRQA